MHDEIILAQWEERHGTLTLTTINVYETGNSAVTKWSHDHFLSLCKGRVLPRLIKQVYGNQILYEILEKIYDLRLTSGESGV